MVTGKPTVYRQDMMVALTKCQLVAKNWRNFITASRWILDTFVWNEVISCSLALDSPRILIH